MSKEKKEIKFLKNSGNNKSNSNYEQSQYGPLIIERNGVNTLFTSNWEPADHKKFIQSIKDHRPQHKDLINKDIEEAISILNEFDSFELLSTITTKNSFVNPECYSEPSHEGKEPYIEYVQSLTLAMSVRPLKKPSNETIERFHKLIERIHQNVAWYFGSEVSEKKRTDDAEQIRYLSLLHYLFVRGYSIPEHYIELIKELFTGHDTFLKNHYSISTENIISCVVDIERQLNYTMNFKMIPSAKLIIELYDELSKIIDMAEIGNVSKIQECKNRFKTNPEIQVLVNNLAQAQKTFPEIPYTIETNENVPKIILDLLSSKLGENKEFIEFKKAPAWPTNDSIIYKKPLIKHNGFYYCFEYQVLFRNLKEIIESWISLKDSDYFLHTYQVSRARFLEDSAVKYFGNLLPGAKIYKNLYYSTVVQNQDKRLETDAIIIFDDNIFILEVKAGNLSQSAKRGSIERLKRDTAALIDEAYSQALNTKSFILNSVIPTFENENGEIVLEIKEKERYKNIFLINVTLDYLGYLSTQLNSLRNLNLINGKEWPWSVFINDLRIISELVQSPSEFLLYLKRRIRSNDFPQFHTADELDYLMYFFKQGLYFEEGFFNDIDKFNPHGYTVQLERFYDYNAGRVSDGSKPTLFIKDNYRMLIKAIEKTNKFGFSYVGTFLLNLNVETQDKLLSGIVDLVKLVDQDGHQHNLTLILDDKQDGLVIGMGPTITSNLRLDMIEFTRRKKYQTKIDNWVLLILEKNIDEIDFEIFKEPWEYNERLENEVNTISLNIVKKVINESGKISRNDFCPCKSGRKYKKCCMNKL